MKFDEYIIFYLCTKCNFNRSTSGLGGGYDLETIEKYKSIPEVCPHCHSGHVSAARIILKSGKLKNEKDEYQCWKFSMKCDKCEQTWDTEIADKKSKMNLCDPKLSCPICDNIEDNMTMAVHKMW